MTFRNCDQPLSFRIAGFREMKLFMGLMIGVSQKGTNYFSVQIPVNQGSIQPLHNTVCPPGPLDSYEVKLRMTSQSIFHPKVQKARLLAYWKLRQLGGKQAKSSLFSLSQIEEGFYSSGNYFQTACRVSHLCSYKSLFQYQVCA